MENRLGENIKFFRKQKGLTQKGLGDLCNMADSVIRRYESGKFTPKDDNLTKIANALGVSTFQLKMRGIENTKEWKYALSTDDYLESIGIDVYYDTVNPDSDGAPLVYLQGHGISIDMEYADYENLKKRLAAYAFHLLQKPEQRRDDDGQS